MSGPTIAPRFSGRRSAARRAIGSRVGQEPRLGSEGPQPMAISTDEKTRTEPDYAAGMPAAGSLVDRAANLAVTVVPLALIGVAVGLSWGGLLVWQDILIFFATLIPFGFGITVGFHRLFTHRSFKTGRVL